MTVENLIRPCIKQLHPYRSARQDYVQGILLDANENAFGGSIEFEGIALNRYPDPYQSSLRKRIGEFNSVDERNVFIGNGSDEVIDLLFRVFCEPAVDSVVIAEPTYGMYRVSADIHNVKTVRSLLDDEFQLDVEDILRKSEQITKLVFCCSPNNPTGNLLKIRDIERLCSSLESVVVVDEAYIEFAGGNSAVELIRSNSNLVVMRTLSKAWGMAGIRLGYCIASSTIIEYLTKVKPPYNINALTSWFALRALGNEAAMRNTVGKIVEERYRLTGALGSMEGITRVFHSDANFLLVRCVDAARLYSELARRGIIVRDRSNEPNLANCLRITVGTPNENDRLIRALGEINL